MPDRVCRALGPHCRGKQGIRKRHFPSIEPGADAAPDPTVLEPILIVAIIIALTAWYVQHKWRKRLRALVKNFQVDFVDPHPQNSVWLSRRRQASQNL
jgi:hypothetical protein